MRKRFFSGTSLKTYETQQKLLEMNKDKYKGREKEKQITMFTNNLDTAVTFAFKRARQDNSIGIIMEITKPDEFYIEKGSAGYIVKGILNKTNHKIYIKEDLAKLYSKVLRKDIRVWKSPLGLKFLGLE